MVEGSFDHVLSLNFIELIKAILAASFWLSLSDMGKAAPPEISYRLTVGPLVVAFLANSVVLPTTFNFSFGNISKTTCPTSPVKAHSAFRVFLLAFDSAANKAREKPAKKIHGRLY